MRALIQRVTQASVTIEGEVTGAIGRGYVVLLGITQSDTAEEARWLAQKLRELRLFEDEAGKMNRSLVDVGGEVLVVSQFTLYAEARRGRRPSFTAAAEPRVAIPLYELFVASLRESGLPVATGRFGAHMHVAIHNDGPVTIWLEREAAPLP